MWNCTHFKHPTDEQLQLIDNQSKNYLLSVPFIAFELYTFVLFIGCKMAFN